MNGRWATEHFDAPQRPTSTVRTLAEAEGQKLEEEIVAFAALGLSPERRLLGRLLGLAERDAAARELALAAGVGEEPVVADANEALREDVEQEPATELGKRERERPGAATAVVLVTQCHDPIVDVKQPMVRDRDAMRVAREVREHMVRAVEGWLGIDDPLGADRLHK